MALSFAGHWTSRSSHSLCGSYRAFSSSILSPAISGKATAEGTLAYRQRFEEKVPFNFNEKTQMNISRIGFGGYRVTEDHSSAIGQSILNGVNLVDTSSNYGDGKSERAIGAVLSDLFEDTPITREEVVVVTKGGYIQGNILEEMKEAEKRGTPWDEVVPLHSDVLMTCISPQFLEDQITASLERLGLETLDFYLLHNPEQYFDSHSARQGPYDPAFYQRITKAFKHLEKEVERGRIQYYGVSSNSLPNPINSHSSVSLEFLLHCAKEASDNHHFAVAQFPLNMLEPMAFNTPNNYNDSKTVLQLCQDAGLVSMAHRPLNAIAAEEMLYRLTIPPDHKGKDLPTLLKEIMDYTIYQEKNYPGCDPNHPMSIKYPDLPPYTELSWAQIIASNLEVLDLYKFQEIVARQIKPVVEKHLKTLAEIDGMQEFVFNYRRGIFTTMEYFQWVLENNRHFHMTNFNDKLTIASATFDKIPLLHHRALTFNLSTGADCTLVGMRENQYVNDVLSIFANSVPHLDEDQMTSVLEFAKMEERDVATKYKADLKKAEDQNAERESQYRQSQREKAED
eukprot:TRINITY_DN7227_c0_g1_i1.p1 TRINITY_DN7227_c0_g1~~TRINITY_DN7227_c0_g1_i1.p1  ORF type:complete len:622 (+),score=121.89 TRINITY_DN7227_c0_g1_i1:170-1867(+)